MTTHNSYSEGLGNSIRGQLDGRIRGLEFDLHDEHIEEKHQFQIGHHTSGHDVDFELNTKSPFFIDWLRIIKDWSDENSNHEPITIFIDIRDDLVNNPPGYDFKFLNKIISDAFTRRNLYTFEDLKNRNDGSLTGTDWPFVFELRNKIIVVLMGHSNTKWRYWKEILLHDQNCFIAFSPAMDEGHEYSEEMLKVVKFVNTSVNNWEWGNVQLNKGKLVRLDHYNPEINFKFKNPIKYPSKMWPKAVCNFPATDHPFEFSNADRMWYKLACDQILERFAPIQLNPHPSSIMPFLESYKELLNPAITLDRLRNLGKILGVSRALADDAERFYKTAARSKIIKWRSIGSFAAASLYLAIKNHGFSRTPGFSWTPSDLSKITGIRTSEIARAYRRLIKVIKEGINPSTC